MPVEVIAFAVFLLIVVAIIHGRALVGSSSGSSLDAQRRNSRRWARVVDVRGLVVKPDELEDRVLFGELDGKLVAAPPNGSVGVLAPTGSGKTSKVVVPSVLRWTGPAVVTSIKGDVLHLTLAQRDRLGEVWVFDPTGVTGRETCHWSPLASVTDYAAAMRAAGWLADSSKVAKGGDDQRFWDDLGEQLLAPMLLLAAQTERSMSDVARWVLRRDEDEVNRLLRDLDDDDALAYWSGVRAAPDRTKQSIFLTAQRILKPFAHPAMRHALDTRVAGDQVFDPGALLDGNGTLYVVSPAGDQAELSPVFETLVNSVVREVENRSARRGGLPIERRLLLMLDEAANIAPLRSLPRIASAGRGEGIVTQSVWQNESQIERIYGRAAAAEVKDNHQAWCYLPGIKDPDTLRYISQLIGPDEFEHSSRSVDSRGAVSRSHTSSEHEVAPLFRIRELEDGQMIVIVENLKPMLVRVRGWFADPSLRRLIPAEIAEGFDREFGARPVRRRRRNRELEVGQ